MRDAKYLRISEWREALLLLASGVMVLMTAATVRAQTSNPRAEANLPTPVVDLIRTKFSGWRPKDVSDLDPENRELWLRPHLNDCPGIAVGHFESPDRLTYAVLLVPQSDSSGGYKLLVFNRMASGDTYVWKLLDHANASYSGLVVETAPPGKYSDYEDARISVTTKLEGFYLEWIEKGALLYYWSAGRYKTVRVSG
jgi:hypothetical protein